MSKFDTLFNSIIITERRTIHSFEDWVDWILTVEEGQAVTFTSTEAFKKLTLLSISLVLLLVTLMVLVQGLEKVWIKKSF